MSASILCFSVTPSGEVFFLLGKQAAPRNGHFTRAANTWCDFGGHEAARDGADQATTAAREFYEESLCCVNIHGGEARAASLEARVSTLAHSLRSGNYVAAISVPVGGHPPPHVCYLKHIPWDAAAPRTFDQMRAAATLIREESKALTWMARRRPEGFRMQFFEHWVHSLAPSKRARITALHWSGAEAVTATFQEPSAVTTVTAPLPDRFAAADVENYRTYIRRTDKMHALWERLTPAQRAHPAIKCTWWRGRVIRMTVQRYFMEMQRITWWGLPVLHDLVRAMGCSRGGVIRGCFMPTIRIALDYLAARHATHTALFYPMPTSIQERKSTYNAMTKYLFDGAAQAAVEPEADVEAASEDGGLW